MKSSHSFGKDERLTRKRDIQELFQKGSSFYLYPFRIIWMENEAENNQVLVSVSRRHFGRAVDRNLLKRRMREGYRLHKPDFTGPRKLNIGFIYTAREVLPSDKIHESIRKALSRLAISP